MAHNQKKVTKLGDKKKNTTKILKKIGKLQEFFGNQALSD